MATFTRHQIMSNLCWILDYFTFWLFWLGEASDAVDHAAWSENSALFVEDEAVLFTPSERLGLCDIFIIWPSVYLMPVQSLQLVNLNVVLVVQVVYFIWSLRQTCRILLQNSPHDWHRCLYFLWWLKPHFHVFIRTPNKCIFFRWECTVVLRTCLNAPDRHILVLFVREKKLLRAFTLDHHFVRA